LGQKTIGFSYKDLKNAAKNFENTEIIQLQQDESPEAYILVIRNGLSQLTTKDLFKQLTDLDWDKKAKMYGRVVNKHARHNLVFGDDSQDPNYEEGKGTIIAFEDVPILNRIRKRLPKYFGEKADNLVAEGNYYYNVTKCGIGFHGDSERTKVIAIRMGESSPLHYQWYKDGSPYGERIMVELNDGDIYVMCSKAVGTDWKKKSIYTLRHATGCDKFVK
jgi:hypothetical protein